MQLFLDLDGVLVDFDRHYIEKFGPLPDRNDPNRDVDWSALANTDFFATAPPMRDVYELYSYVSHYDPVVLTGVPSMGTEKAAADKRAWVERYFPNTHVITCRSKDKCLHMQPGDVIVDDWHKYRPLWEQKGGVWVLHTSARNSIAELKAIGL